MQSMLQLQKLGGKRTGWPLLIATHAVVVVVAAAAAGPDGEQPPAVHGVPGDGRQLLCLGFGDGRGGGGGGETSGSCATSPPQAPHQAIQIVTAESH